MKVNAALRVMLALFATACPAYSQPRDNGCAATKATVNSIDASVARLQKSSLKLETGTDRGGELTVYRKGSTIVRIDATVGLSNADVNDVFYYSGRNLIFVTTKKLHYHYSQTLQGFDFGIPSVVSENSYCVVGRKLILLTRSSKPESSIASNLVQEGEFLVREAKAGRQAVNIEALLK